MDGVIDRQDFAREHEAIMREAREGERADAQRMRSEARWLPPMSPRAVAGDEFGIADHEAGHAVSAIVLGVGIDYVTTEASEDHSGHVRYSYGQPLFSRQFRAQVGITVAAGVAAERRGSEWSRAAFFDEPERSRLVRDESWLAHPQVEHDYKTLLRFAAGIPRGSSTTDPALERWTFAQGESDPVCASFVRYAWREACHLVANKRAWQAIEYVSADLIARRRLSGVEVASIVAGCRVTWRPRRWRHWRGSRPLRAA